MLEALRKRSASFLIKLLFGLLILSFVSWGVGDFIRGRANVQVVAEVGDVEITPQDLNREYMFEISRMEQLFGQRLDREQARAFGLLEATLGQMINNSLWDQAAAGAGITTSDAAIRAIIQNDRSFMDQTGQFSRQRFEQALASTGFNEQSYVASLRQRMARAQLADSVIAGTEPPKALVDAIYRYRQEKRIVETLLIADSAMTGIGEPSDDELAEYHSENADLFTAPEYRAVSVLNLRAGDLVDEVTVTDEEVQDLYAQRQAEFDQPEMRSLRQIVVPDEETAEEVYAAIKEGRDFAEVAKDIAGMDQATTEVGEVRRDMLLTELADAAFALIEGATSKPVESPLGWHVVKVDSVTPPKKQTVEEVRDILSKDVALEKSIDALFDLANRVEDALGGGATLEEAARQLDLNIQKVEAIDANGRDTEGNEVAEIPPGGKFIQTVFETPETEDSLLTEAGHEAYFVLRVDTVTPSAVKPLAEVRTEVTEAWKAKQRSDKAKVTAEAMAQRLDNGTSPAEIAKELGIEVKTTEPFTRLAPPNGANISPPLVQSVFAAETGESVTGPGAGGHVIARVTKVIEANPGSDSAGVKAVTESLANSIQGDVQAQFVGALRQDLAVSINQKALDEAF